MLILFGLISERPKSCIILYIFIASWSNSFLNKTSNEIICFSNLFKKGGSSSSIICLSTKTITLKPSFTKENVLFELPIAILEYFFPLAIVKFWLNKSYNEG